MIATIAVMQRAPQAQPVAIAALPAPAAQSPQCAALVDALPDRARRLPPRPAGGPGAAGRPPPGSAEQPGEALILRCGLDRPAEFVTGAPVQVVDEVQWFRVQEPGAAQDSRSTWFAVDRPVYVALTLPADSGPTPIQVLSQTIAETLPARAPEPGPVGPPPR